MQRSFTLFFLTALTLALAACSTPSTRFYTLAPQVAATASAAAPGATARQTFIEILPVSVPERLARPQIVVRSDETRVEILEQDRWSAPFNNELHDALASGIANRLGAIDVTRGGGPANQPVYRIVVELRRLDAVKGGKVEAGFGWTVTRSDNNTSAVCRLSVVEPTSGLGVDGVVQGLQRAVAHAADAIAADVAALREGQADSCRS